MSRYNLTIKLVYVSLSIGILDELCIIPLLTLIQFSFVYSSPSSCSLTGSVIFSFVSGLCNFSPSSRLESPLIFPSYSNYAHSTLLPPLSRTSPQKFRFFSSCSASTSCCKINSLSMSGGIPTEPRRLL